MEIGVYKETGLYLTCDLAFTRYCFTLQLLCGSQSTFIAPSHLHCPHYCNTIARLLRKIRRPPDPPFVCYKIIQYWKWQYRVKANLRFAAGDDEGDASRLEL